MVGKVQQDVLFFHYFENAGKGFDVRVFQRRHDAVFKVGPHAGKVHETAHHVVASARVKLAALEVEF